MPLYDFKCSECKERFEKIISAYKIKEVRCPKCGSEKVAKLFSLFSQITGSGCQSNSYRFG
jgi:putative FmdB family regulatory protein